MKRITVAPGHFVPTPEAEARCLREYGFDRRHLYVLMVVCAAWRADRLPIVGVLVDRAVERERGLTWAKQCLLWLERHRYVQRVGKTGKNGGELLFAPTQLGLSTCPAPPADDCGGHPAVCECAEHENLRAARESAAE